MSDLMTGLATLLTLQNILLLVGGVLIGMIVGVIPGVGPSAGLAILLPVTFGLDPTGAIVMLAAVYYGAMYGGTITSVLINTPGESATVASTFDGYPLAKQGRAGPALVMAAVGSFVAGTIGAVLLSASPHPSPPISHRPSARPSTSLSSIAGLLTVIVILRGNKLLGALSALIGFAIGTVGIDIGGGGQRYTFGSVDLINGVDFIPVAIGLFAVGEVLHTLWRGGHLEQLAFFGVSARSRGFWPNRKDFRESVGPTLRGSFLGFGVGSHTGRRRDDRIVDVIQRREIRIAHAGEVRQGRDGGTRRAGVGEQRRIIGRHGSTADARVSRAAVRLRSCLARSSSGACSPARCSWSRTPSSRGD